MALEAFNIGSMRSIVTVQRNSAIDQNEGSQSDNWIDLFTRRGQLQTRSSNKVLADGSVEFVQTNYLYMRYSNDFVIDADTRLLIDGSAYKITGQQLQDQIKHIYLFTLSAIA